MLKTWRLNPKYIISKIKRYFYFKNNPSVPWLSKDANEFLEKNLKKDMIVLEFGSGRSTFFFAKRVKYVISREHDTKFYKAIKKKLEVLKLDNVMLTLHEKPEDYVNIDNIPNESIDVVLIDGIERARCLLNSLEKLKKGGLLILDNAERYLLYPTKSPAKFLRRNREKIWEEIERILEIRFWRFDTTDGVSDTLLFIKRI